MQEAMARDVMSLLRVARNFATGPTSGRPWHPGYSQMRRVSSSFGSCGVVTSATSIPSATTRP
eukprot:36339-Eustigmatos_ZCMA.PRE.1